MANPWLKKNPFLSMWLSAANSAAGSARGLATAQAKRAGRTAATNATREMMNLWLAPLSAGTAKKRRKR